MKKSYLFIGLCLLVQMAYGQYQIGIIPRVSPDKMVYQKIGYTEVEVKYGSPSVNNRVIFGELVPYGKVWRAGANSATTVEFRSSVNVGDMQLDSGKYTFFLLPKENDKWTAIFNKVPKQWGAFRYDQKEDALRIEVRPRTTNYKTENLTYTINQTGFKYGSITCAWDFMEIEVPFETNYLTAFQNEVEARASKQPAYIKWLPYMQGAEHLVDINDNIDLAKKWIDEAEMIMDTTTDWNKQFYPREYIKGHLYWIKAQVLAWDNDYAGAAEYVDKLKGLEETSFYDKRKDREEIDVYYKKWKDK